MQTAMPVVGGATVVALGIGRRDLIKWSEWGRDDALCPGSRCVVVCNKK